MAAKSSAPKETDKGIELPEMSQSRDVEKGPHRGGNNNYPQHDYALMEEEETAFEGDRGSNINVSSTQAILGPNNNTQANNNTEANKGICHWILKEILMFLSILPCSVLGGFLGFWAGLFIFPALQWNLLANELFRFKAFRGVDATIRTLLGKPRSDMNKEDLIEKWKWQSWVWGTNIITRIVLFPLAFLHHFLLYPLYVIVMVVLTVPVGMFYGCLLGFYLGCVVPSRIISDRMDKERTDMYSLETALVDCKVLIIREYPRKKGASIRQVEGSMLFYFLMAFLGTAGLSTGFFIVFYITIFMLDYFAIFWILVVLSPVYVFYTILGSYVSTVEELRQEFIEHAKHLDEEETTQEEKEEEDEVQVWSHLYTKMLAINQHFTSEALTEGGKNWTRLAYLLADEGTKCVKDWFTRKLQEKQKTLEMVLNENRERLTKRRPSGVGLTQNQKRLIFPSEQKTAASVDEFDLTLLMHLITTSNLLSTKPDGGWHSAKEPTDPYQDPQADPSLYQDQICANNLLRLRLIRNRLYAGVVDCNMTKEQFELDSSKLKTILQILGANPGKIDQNLRNFARTLIPENRTAFAERVAKLFVGDRLDVESLKEETIQNHREIKLQEVKMKEEEHEKGGTDDKTKEWMDKYNEMLERAQNFSNAALTDEEEYWVQFAFLLVDEGTLWVRGLFMGRLQNTLPARLSNERQFLMNARGKDSLSEAQRHVLFPANQPAKSADNFDLTLLVRLFSILKVLPKVGENVWKNNKEPKDPKPETKDDYEDYEQNIYANNLIRMRLMRNELYAHVVDCKMKKERFEEEFPKVKAILISFGATMDEIDENVKKLKATPESRKDFAKRVTTLFSEDRADVERLMEKTIKNHEGIQDDAVVKHPEVVTLHPRNETRWEDR